MGSLNDCGQNGEKGEQTDDASGLGRLDICKNGGIRIKSERMLSIVGTRELTEGVLARRV